MIVNKNQLAEIVGVSERTLTDYQQDGMPIQSIGGRGIENQYDSAKVIEWLVQRAVAGKSKLTPQDALYTAKARREELELVREAGKVVAIEDVEPVWLAGILAARADLLGLGARLKASLDARYGINVEQQMIDDMVFGALQKLSERALPDEEEDAEIEEAMEDPD